MRVAFCPPIAHCPQTDHGRCVRAYCSVPAHSPRPCSGSTARPLPPLTCLCPKGRVHPAPDPRNRYVWVRHRLSTCSLDFPNASRSTKKKYISKVPQNTAIAICTDGTQNQRLVHMQNPPKQSTCDVYRWHQKKTIVE